MDIWGKCLLHERQSEIVPALLPVHLQENLHSAVIDATQRRRSMHSTSIRIPVVYLSLNVSLGPWARRTKQTEIDLTAGRLFLRDPKHATSLLDVIGRHAGATMVPWEPDRNIPMKSALQVLLNAMRGIYSLWSKSTVLHANDLVTYAKFVQTMRQAWKALAWKLTPWVHWVLSHSVAVLNSFRTLYIFSSIPTEARHRAFKHDLRRCCYRGRRTNPSRVAQSFATLVERNAMDKGLEMYVQDCPHSRKRKRKTLAY